MDANYLPEVYISFGIMASHSWIACPPAYLARMSLGSPKGAGQSGLLVPVIRSAAERRLGTGGQPPVSPCPPSVRMYIHTFWNDSGHSAWFEYAHPASNLAHPTTEERRASRSPRGPSVWFGSAAAVADAAAIFQPTSEPRLTDVASGQLEHVNV